MNSSAFQLEAQSVGYRVGGRVILDQVSLGLRTGSLVALLGPNGAGKTTLLRLLLGLQKPSSGEIVLEGRPMSAYRRSEIGRRLAYVPQGHSPVFPYLVREVVALGRLPWSTLGGSVSASDREAVAAAMIRVNIAHLSERPYTQLSGGERQGVLIARALAQGARTLIFDEPASALDFGQQIRLESILRGLAAEGLAILATTHDPLRARTAFDRAVLLSGGRVLADGPAVEVLTDAAIHRLYGCGD